MATVKRKVPVLTGDPQGTLALAINGEVLAPTASLANAVAALLEVQTDPSSIFVDFALGTVQLVEEDPDVILADWEMMQMAGPFDDHCEIFGVPTDSGKSIEFNTAKRSISVNVVTPGIAGVSDVLDPVESSVTISALVDRLEREEVCKQVLILQAPALAGLLPVAPEGAVIASTQDDTTPDNLRDYVETTFTLPAPWTGMKVEIDRSDDPVGTDPSDVFE